MENKTKREIEADGFITPISQFNLERNNNIKKYKVKVPHVKAIQYTGDNLDELYELTDGIINDEYYFIHVGDYVIINSSMRGDFRIVDPYEFEYYYEEL